MIAGGMSLNTKQSKLSWQKTHMRDILLLVLTKYKIVCYFCHKPFTIADFPKRLTDLITEHHCDGDHMNMDIDNRELSHRRCHQSHHMKERRRQ